MNRLQKIACWFALVTFADLASAGSSDGLKIAAIPTQSGTPFSKFVKQFMFENSDDQIRCGANYVDQIFIDPVPTQLTGEQVVAAIDNKAKRKQIGKILSKFHDHTVLYGFDGVLTYEIKASRLHLYGISANPKYRVGISTISLEDAEDQSKFNRALCKALTNLSLLTAP